MSIYKLYRLTLHDLRMSSTVRGGGALWTVAEPAILTGTLWLVMHLIVQAPPVGEIPYSAWFVGGYLPWQFFQRTALESTGVIRKHAYLLRQADPPVCLLPMLPVCSSLLIHLFQLSCAAWILRIGRISCTVDLRILLRSTLCLTALAAGVSFLLSVMSLRFPWVRGLTGTVLQIWFWITPVAWHLSGTGRRSFSGAVPFPAVGEEMLFRVNPLCGIVGAYRQAFFAVEGSPVRGTVCVTVLAAGILYFERYKGEIADAV